MEIQACFLTSRISCVVKHNRHTVDIFSQFRSGKNGQNTSSLKFFICTVERYKYFNNKCFRTYVLYSFTKKSPAKSTFLRNGKPEENKFKELKQLIFYMGKNNISEKEQISFANIK